MRSVVIVTTASGTGYVLSVSDGGVSWRRVPGLESDGLGSVGGWEPAVPRIVPGERLLIGNLRTTPVVRVAVIPT